METNVYMYADALKTARVICVLLQINFPLKNENFSDNSPEEACPVPEHFSGICEVTLDFPSGSCNRKVVDARHFAASAITRGIFSAPRTVLLLLMAFLGTCLSFTFSVKIFPSGSCKRKLVGARHFAASSITRGIFSAPRTVLLLLMAMMKVVTEVEQQDFGVPQGPMKNPQFRFLTPVPRRSDNTLPGQDLAPDIFLNHPTEERMLNTLYASITKWATKHLL
ncbi:hypothetical protein HAX54_046299 [Datura stramonium]|uniref:Uncharacterized protein n=1 Tax=Datura stramonium TaxID=4076 RepID=A0ABS8SRN0_DATST|nr:hypothetical protein [Datura stramonium]